MVNSLLVSSSQTLTSTANTTQFWGVFNAISIGNPTVSTTESAVQHLMRSPGTLSNMFIRLTGNTISATPSVTIRSRVNAGNGNQVVTFASTTSGTQTDSTNTDAITAGQKVDISTVPGATTGVITFAINAFIFAANSNTVTRMGSSVGAVTTGLFTTSNTIFQTLSGDLSTGTYNGAAETIGEKCRQQKAGTFKNLCANCSNNTISANTTVTSRKGGGAGAMTATVTANLTGFFEDTTNSDSVVVNDDFDTEIVTGATGTSMTIAITSVDFVSTTGDCQFEAASDSQAAISTATTREFGLAGSALATVSTEVNTETTAQSAFLFSNITCFVRTNTIAATSTVTLRANTANPSNGPSVSIGSTATGVIADTTHTYTAATTDALDNQIVVGTSSSHSLKLAWIAIWGTLPVSTSNPIFMTTKNDISQPKFIMANSPMMISI